MSHWQLEMLGGLHLFHSSRERVRLRTRKTEALLAYLALFPYNPHTREHLAALLWESSEPQAARNSLSVALHALRSVLRSPDGSSLLLTDPKTVRLDTTHLATDVVRFEQALQDADTTDDEDHQLNHLYAALACYRGPLLSAFYEAWILPERSRLELYAHDGMRRIVRLLAKRQELSPALDYALRAAVIAPFQEANCRDVMRLYTALGRPHDALTYYRDFARRLREETATLPSTATVALADELTRTAPAAPFFLVAPRPQDAALDRFFGRTTEQAVLQNWLTEGKDRAETAALITLTGMGGVGKTRLAKEMARTGAALFGTRIYFFSLAEETNADCLFETLCSAMRLPRAADTLPLEQLAGVFGTAPTLLILDNFEQLVEGGDEQVQTLRHRIPHLTLLVTSRRCLNVAGERELVLSPFPIPPPEESTTPDSLEAFDSVRLFVDRCRQHQPDFALTSENAATVAQICARLDGLPLALELAAAWSRTLAPAQMLTRLQQRFDLLVSTRRDLPDRHRSLRATVESSYRLLSPELRRFFRQLSVFVGGWTLEAATTICGEEALTGLAALQAASLVVTEHNAEGIPRFRLLETLRDFAVEQQPADERAAIQTRYIAYFTALAEQGQQALRHRDRRHWHTRLEAEHDNFRNALALCFGPNADSVPTSPDAVENGIRLTMALMKFWHLRGYQSEWERWQRVAYAAADTVAPALRAALYMEIFEGYPAALDARFAERAWALGEELQAPLLIAQSHLLTGSNVFHQERDYARALHCVEEAVTLLQDAGRPDLLGRALKWRGVCYFHLRPAEATAAFDAALTTLRQGQAFLLLSEALFDAAFHITGPEENERAEVLLEEALALCVELDHRGGRAHGLWILGKIVRRRDPERAEACFRESLELHCRYGFSSGKALPLYELGIMALLKEEYTTAQAFFHEAYAGRSPADLEGMDNVLLWCALGMGDEAEFHACCENYLRYTAMAPIARNLVLTKRLFANVRAGKFTAVSPLYAELVALWEQQPHLQPDHLFFLAAAHWMTAQKQPAIASRLLGMEDRSREEHHALRFPLEAHLIAQTETLLRNALPETDYTVCYAEGRAMDAPTRRSFCLSLPEIVAEK